MTTEQQDLAWACLPKEVREEKRKEYRIVSKNPRLDRGDSIYLTALDNIFGHHNLTSDTEPAELLFVERKKVQKLYSQLQDRYKEIKTKTIPKNIGQGHDYVVSERGFVNGAISELKLLFGDKCLPDKEPSAQVEPRFKVGDKVIVSHFKKVGVVREIKSHPCIGFNYEVETGKDSYFIVHEVGVEPYTEPETKDMEEKELNLVELLKGCDETAFYSPTFGVVLLKAITENDNKPLFWDFGVMTSYTYADGRIYSDSVPTIFPSRALYDKYPLDPVKAWSIWASERKPKRWRAEEGKEYWYLSAFVIPEITSDDLLNGDDKLYECGNYFRTKIEAQQASEAVRETLMKIHEQNQKQYEKDSKTYQRTIQQEAPKRMGITEQRN